MTSLKDAIGLDKPLDSLGMPQSFPGPVNPLFHTLLAGGNGGYSTPCIMDALPGSVLLEDLGVLDVNPFEHDIILPGLDSESVMALHGDPFAGMQHSEPWNASAESTLPSWNASTDQSSYLLQKDVEVGSNGMHSGYVGGIGGGQTSWCRSVVHQQDKNAAPLDRLGSAVPLGALAQVAPSPEKRKSSEVMSAAAATQGLRRSPSSKHVCKPCYSSEISDDFEDDDGDKHQFNMRQSPSKNLVSERRRRQKLNERLYSLRALVPKISKMDKASIVSDAISYVEDLRKQVDDIQADINALESNKGTSRPVSCHESKDAPTVRRTLFTKQYLEHRILELEVSQMEEQTYNLRIHCKKGPGVLVQLTSALEALDLEIVNANLTSVNDHVLNTVVVKVGSGEAMTPEELKRRTLDVVPKFGLLF